jgi:hypothetical protein
MHVAHRGHLANMAPKQWAAEASRLALPAANLTLAVANARERETKH